MLTFSIIPIYKVIITEVSTGMRMEGVNVKISMFNDKEKAMNYAYDLALKFYNTPISYINGTKKQKNLPIEQCDKNDYKYQYEYEDEDEDEDQDEDDEDNKECNKKDKEDERKELQKRKKYTWPNSDYSCWPKYKVCVKEDFLDFTSKNGCIHDEFISL